MCSLLLKNVPWSCKSELTELEVCGPVGVIDGLPVFPSIVGPLLTGVVVVGVLAPSTMLVQTPLRYC